MGFAQRLARHSIPARPAMLQGAPHALPARLGRQFARATPARPPGPTTGRTQALDARLDIAARCWTRKDRAYLAACHARHDAARAEADARRRERAEEDARPTADAQALAASARRAAIVLASVLALAIITTVFAVYGFVSAREALSNFNSARSIALDLLRPVAPTADAPERLDVLQGRRGPRRSPHAMRTITSSPLAHCRFGRTRPVCRYPGRTPPRPCRSSRR